MIATHRGVEYEIKEVAPGRRRATLVATTVADFPVPMEILDLATSPELAEAMAQATIEASLGNTH
jgi:hypothetical protein